MFAILALIAIDLYVLKSTGVAQEEKPVEEITEDKPVEWTVYCTSWC